MTFDWALSKLRDGAKVYRKSNLVSWSKFVPWIGYKKLPYSDVKIWESMFPDVHLKPEDLEANDWEVYEDDKVCQCAIEDWRDLPTGKKCLVCGGKTGV